MTLTITLLEGLLKSSRIGWYYGYAACEKNGRFQGGARKGKGEETMSYPIGCILVSKQILLGCLQQGVAD